MKLSPLPQNQLAPELNVGDSILHPMCGKGRVLAVGPFEVRAIFAKTWGWVNKKAVKLLDFSSIKA